MKSILFVLAFIFCGASFAQETKDKKEETETKTVKVKTEKGVTEKKVKVTTTEKGDTKLKEDPDHYENMDVADRDKTVTQTMSIVYDDDPFYDTDEVIVQHYDRNGNHYMFQPVEYGFTMSKKDEMEGKKYGHARLSSQNRFYLVSLGENNGIGYFKGNGKFVVEYYDKTNNAMVVEEYSVMKQ